MATIRKTITITEAQDDQVKTPDVSGNYTDDSECLRDLIRLEQKQACALKAAIDEGLASDPCGRSLSDIWVSAEARYRTYDN